MNYGRFFVLDLEASDLTHGISVFNYRGIKYEKDDGKCEEKRDTPKYPIYLQFTPKGVFFYIHYAIKKELDKEDFDIVHQNSPILSLLISSNFDIKDNLTDCLNNIFYTTFPDNAKDNCIYDIIERNVRSSEKQKKDITYSSLEIFGINYCKPQVDRPSMIGFIRKLFLDFLYDLKHTGVFENASDYDEIYIKLHENFLFNAIANKAEYYYQRKQQQKSPEVDCPWKAMDWQLFYSDFYSKAEQKWIETITDPKADRCFYESDWFSDVETEMNRVYISGAVRFRLPVKKGHRPEYLVSEKTKCCHEYVSDIVIKGGYTDEYLSIVRSKREIKERLKLSAKSASNWYLKKYSFSGTTKIWYGKNYIWFRSIIVLFILSLCSVLIIPSVQEEILPDQVIPPLIIVCSLFVLWLSGFINYKEWYMRGIGCLNILMPRLFASIVAAWFTLAVGEDVFKGFFDYVHQPIVSIGLLLILIVFVYYEIGKINPYIDIPKRFIRSLILMLVAFSYAFIVGLLVIDFFGGRYLERSDYIDEFYINSVYTATPDFGIETVKQPLLVHDIFYKTLEKYNDTIVPLIANYRFDLTLLNKSDNFYKIKDDLYYPTLPVKNRVGSYIGSVDYRFTLLLLKQFIKKDSIPFDRIQEKMFEGSTINSRVERVVNFYNSLVCGKPVYIVPVDSGEYHSAWVGLLKSIDNHQVYRESLKYLKPLNGKRTSILSETKTGTWIFRDMLLQFTFFAMFIGIFIQLIFEEKVITEPV